MPANSKPSKADDIALLRRDLETKIDALENRLLIKLGGFGIVIAGLTLTIAKMI